MTKTLEQNQAFVKALFDAVDEKGHDYVYQEENCVYILDGKPVCLIAVALVKAGHTEKEILNDEGVIALAGSNGENASSKMSRMGYDSIICWAAKSAQYIQDTKGTWGEALKEFTNYLREEGVWDKYAPAKELSTMD